MAMSIATNPDGPTEFWESKAKPWRPPRLRRPFNTAEDSDIKLSDEAERLLLQSSSSASSQLTLDDWTDGFRAAFDLDSSTNLVPNAVEPLRSIACLMAQTKLPTLSNDPDPAVVSLATMQWTAANALFGCPSHDDALTTDGKPFPCNEVPMTGNTDDARKLLAKNGYLPIVVNDEPSPLWRTGNEWLSTSSLSIAPHVHSEERTQLRLRAEGLFDDLCQKNKIELTWDQFWGVLFHAPDDNEVCIMLKQFALSLALTPPTFFYRDFTDGGGDQPICGFLLPTSATNQWYGALKAFGTPWYDPSSHNVVRGVQWTAVSLCSSTTTQTWQEAAVHDGLQGLTSSEVHNDDPASACVMSAMTRAGYLLPNELDAGNWHFVFQTAFAADQQILTDWEATCVKKYASRLAITQPSSFGILFVVDDANPDLGFLPINFTTAPWLAAAAIFGSANRKETACQSTTTGSAAAVNGIDVLSTLDEAKKNDLMIAINAYTPAATYYAKVLVAGSIAAALSHLSLVQFALDETDSDIAAVLKWYYADKNLPFPKLVELKDRRFAVVRDGYQQLKDATKTVNAATAIRLQLGQPNHFKQKEQGLFQTLPKATINGCNRTRRNGSSTTKQKPRKKRSTKQKPRKKKQEAKAAKKRMQETKEEQRRQDEAKAQAKKKQDEADEAQRKRDDEEQRTKDEASKEMEADEDYNNNNRGADDAPTTSEDDSELEEVNREDPARKSPRKHLHVLPLQSNKRSKLEHERPALLTSTSTEAALLTSTSTEATISFDSPPTMDATGKYSPPGGNWTKRKTHIVGMLMRLVIILEYEDNIISPRNAWKSTVCKDFDMSDQLNDHSATCFTSLIFNILLVLKKNRGDNEVIGIVLELARQELLRVNSMAAASEIDVTSIVQRHSKDIDARWMKPLAAELIAVHRGITPVTYSALRRLESVKHVLSEEGIILFFQALGSSSGLVVDADSRKILVAMGMIDVDEYVDPSTHEFDMNKLENGKVEESLMTWIPRRQWQTFQDTIRTLVEMIKFPESTEQMARTLGKRIKEKFVDEEQQVLVAAIHSIAAVLRDGNECDDWLHWLHGDEGKQCDSVTAESKPHPISNPFVHAVTGSKASPNASAKPNPTVMVTLDPLWLPPLERSDFELIESYFLLPKGEDPRLNAIITLGPPKKLNDEAIDLWSSMINAREAKRFPEDVYFRTVCLSCFFWTKLMQIGNRNPGYNFKAVSRWLSRRKVDILSYSSLMFPINILEDDHWVLVVAHLWKKEIHYLDSCGASGVNYLEMILRYIEDEHGRKKLAFTKSEWSLIPCDSSKVPRQENGYDCGVYVCLFVDFIARDCTMNFTPEQVTSMRYHIAHAIIKSSAPRWPKQDEDIDEDIDEDK